MGNSSLDLYNDCDRIVNEIPKGLSNDQKIRRLYREVGKLLSKSPEFFYEKNPEKQREIYENYQMIHNREVICRSVVHLYCNLAAKLGLKCRPLEMDDIEGIQFNHWALVYENEKKKYLINPIPDFYRVQLGFSTRHFCHSEEYYGCSTEVFNSMSDEYLRELDESLGYLDSGYYTDELLEKFSTEMRSKLGTHIIKTSDFYQEYYLTLLNLIKNKKMTLEEKMEEISQIDPELDKHKSVVEKVFKDCLISKDMNKIIHTVAYKGGELLNSSIDFSKHREGADFIGSMDITNLREMKKEIMLYKFHYMIHCIPKFTYELTGYIENKNFIEELSKYIFQTSEERECIHRHTVVQDTDDGKKEYYLMFSIKDPEAKDSFYCFYNHKDKTFKMPIEPLSFMLEHKMSPLKDSTLNEKIINEIRISQLCIGASLNLNQNIAKK